MPRPLRRFLAPLTDGLTYRRFVHLLLGAVILLPYVGLGALITTSMTSGDLDVFGALLVVVPGVVIAFGVALVPGVRALAITAARALLGATVPEPDPATADSWPARRRAAGWLVLNAAAGAVTALVTLAVLPITIGFLFAPWLALRPFPTGGGAWWLPPVGLVLPVLLLHAASASGAALARLAPRVLGPTPTERMAAELAEAHAAERALAERNRLARELHDSVGHALTITTLQAGAAARVLETDPAFVARALDAIAEAGRSALADLDHVLGLLRNGSDGTDGADDRAPQPDLGDLDALVDGARSAGVAVELHRDGATDAVPRAVSREAYRIVQEGLTNALRHAGPVPVAVRVAVRDDAVELELTNPLGDARARPRTGGGRGLAGMRERVTVLRGELCAGGDEERWRVTARLPLAGTRRMPG
ncbi:sensor histidine kinase [Pseudonocardia kunmingensis]|uniref:sensor histidine kinase n=1 Tax=Pseudonocardia kunmingensis TaxID=630975 RepID=UPI001FE30149|nr:histidine kinase [Pseudonocardia kunmingensis]